MRKHVAAKLPTLLKRFWTTDTARDFAGLRFMRHGCLIAGLIFSYKLVGLAPMAAALVVLLQFPEIVMSAVWSLAVALGLLIGLHLGRQSHRSLVALYVTMPDRIDQPFLARVRNSYRHLFRSPDYLLHTFGVPFVAVLCSALLLLLRGGGPSLRLTLLAVFALQSMLLGIAIGLLFGLFLYGDWIEPCAQFARRSPLRVHA